MKKKQFYMIGSGLALVASIVIGANLVGQNQPESTITVEVGQYTQQAEPTEYSVLLYMVGSDLESDVGAATANLQELLENPIDDVRIIGEAGGSTKWHTEGFEAGNNTRFLIEDGKLSITQNMESRNMGNASTLADFLCYACTSYPAEKTILILWNHGAGPVDGFGYDTIYGGDTLSLMELDAAFQGAKCDKQPLDMIGLDACCMATLETALVLSPYADYMVASQEMEPSGGWDYTSIANITDYTSIKDIAVMLAQSYYEKNITQYIATTVSIIDLSKTEPLAEWIEKLAKELREHDLSQLMPDRSKVIGFGGAGRAAGQSDLVDLYSFANSMLSHTSQTPEQLEQLLKQAIIKSYSQDKVACGLSLYAPYAELEQVADKLNTYSMLSCLPEYEMFAVDIADYLMRAKLEETNLLPLNIDDNTLTASIPKDTKEVYLTLWEQDELQPEYYYLLGTDSDVEIDNNTCIASLYNEWTYLGGQPLCTIELESPSGLYTQFACPVQYEGKLANLILQYDTQYPYGRVVCIIPVDNDSFSRQIVTLKGGEKITPLYPVEALNIQSGDAIADYQSVISGFKIGEEIIYSPDMELESLPSVESEYYGFWFITWDNRNLYTMVS